MQILYAMRMIAFSSFILLVQGLYVHLDDRAMARDNNSIEGLLIPRGNDDGRVCDFSQGYYVSWSDTSEAIKAWCSSHAGQTLGKGTSKSDTVQKTGGTYMAGKQRVKLYGMLIHFRVDI